MRTTLDLPDDLFRQVKARAALDGTSLKKLLRAYVEEGLRRGSEAPSEGPRKRSPIPVARPASGRRIPALSNSELQGILMEEDLQRDLGSRSG